MSPPKMPTLEEFRARAAQTGMPLTNEDIEHLHKGYVGLLELMQRIPSPWAWAAEPPQVFRGAGGGARGCCHPHGVPAPHGRAKF